MIDPRIHVGTGVTIEELFAHGSHLPMRHLGGRVIRGITCGDRDTVASCDVEQAGGLIARSVDHRQAAERKLRVRETRLQVDHQYRGTPATADHRRAIADVRVAVAHAALLAFAFSLTRCANCGCRGGSRPVSFLQRALSSSIESKPRSKSFTDLRSARSFSRSTVVASPSAVRSSRMTTPYDSAPA